MEFIRLTHENLDAEHICCAISNNKDVQVSSKKEWLAERLDEGLVFLKGNVRSKCFIEYIPAENAWAPIAADGYMYIDCLFGSRDNSRDTDIPPNCLPNVFGTAAKRGKRGFAFCLRKRNTVFCPTRNIFFIKASNLPMRQLRISNFGICRLTNRQKFRNSVLA